MILGLYCEAKRNATVVTINLNGQCDTVRWYDCTTTTELALGSGTGR